MNCPSPSQEYRLLSEDLLAQLSPNLPDLDHLNVFKVGV